MNPKRDQPTNEAASRRARGAKKDDTNQQSEMKVHKAEDDVLGAIESVESQLGALRKAHEEHRQVMADLSQRRREVEEHAEELASRENELTTREVELAEIRQDFESREMNLVQRAGGLEQRESKIASQAELLERQEAELEAKDKQLEQKIQELDNQLAGLSKRKGELQSLEKEAKAKIDREDKASAKLVVVSKELAELSSRVESMSQELIESQKSHKATAAELDAVVSKLRGREIELAERAHTIEELAEKSGAIQHELDTTREQFGKQLAETSEQLAREQTAAQDLRTQIDQIKSEQDQVGSQSASQVSKLTEQLNKAIAQIKSLEASTAELDAKSTGRVGELTKELEKTRAQAKGLSEQVNEIARCADEELTSERKRIVGLESQIGTLTANLEQASSKSASLEAQTKELIDAKPDVDPEELVSLKGELDLAQGQADEVSDKLSKAIDALGKMKDEINARDVQLEKADTRISELEEQSSSLIASVEELNTKLEETQSVPKGKSDEWTQKRRARLEKMRSILRGDAEKIRLATDALRSRYDQCEQVLSKRSELAEAYQEISSAQRKYQNREVRSGVFLGLIGMAAITLVLAATSWFVSGRVVPGMYAAKVTLAAASGDSKLTEVEMEQWETYITQLASDPRFLEVAADRMKRRGIGEFGIPGDLATEMNQSLDVASAMPGTIVMEYRGVGAERTERVLDTFSVALSSAANNARARRADSSMTIIEEEATAGDAPLDTRRIEAAGMIFGGGVLLTLILGGVIWKRLSAAKAKFERESSVEALFDDSQWQMPG